MSEQSRENPEAPLDPANFIQSLPPALRQQVLADMDDSMVAILPADLAAEANVLRRELEDRHRRLMQERLFAQGAGLLSGILRHSGENFVFNPPIQMEYNLQSNHLPLSLVFLLSWSVSIIFLSKS